MTGIGAARAWSRIVGAVVVAVGSMLALTALPASAALPPGPWVHPAADISAPDRTAREPQVTFSPDGTATAVWRSSDGANTIVQAATRPPGGVFGTPVDLSESGRDAEHPQISSSPDGTVTAVWQHSDGANTIIQAATRPPDGGFGSPVDLSEPGQDAGGPQLTSGPDGATAVWQRSDGANTIVQAATLAPGGDFGDPVDLSEPGQDAVHPQVDSSPAGTTTAVWERSNGTNMVVQAATRPAGGSFGDPAPISETGPGPDAFAPQIASGADDTAIVVWHRWNGSREVVQAATRESGGSFGAPVDISDTSDGAFGPQIAFGPDSTAIAVWRRDAFGITRIQAAIRPPGGAFGQPVEVSGAGGNANEPRIVFGPDGTATSVWRRVGAGSYVIQAASRPPGGAFGTPVDLSAAGGDAQNPQADTAPDGTVLAVWRRFDHVDIIQSINTLRPSPLVGVAKLGSGEGTVTSSAAGIECGPVCAGSFPSFTNVTLTATPEPDSTFEGWRGACAGAAGNTCDLAMVDNRNVIADFAAAPPGKPELRISRVVPKNPKVEPGEVVKIQVTGKNVGEAVAENAKLCLKVNGSVRQKLKPKGDSCHDLDSLDPGQAKTRAFRLKATAKSEEGRKYQIKYKLYATGTSTAKRPDKVKVV
ncbi:MAG: hypothetical protein KDB62_08715 [Solirubrobacterales bacterium]|nr:hypothetical protein [Solirubrobacterales bacterium]